mmetsp:Transcript_14368/g.21537  ORF Transcript_14368/g.21537 Transcript_14368/m.21537 type:complete len:288 (+) Transcript_14368:67-930(+)
MQSIGNVDFYRASVTLFTVGLVLLLAVVPLLIKEASGRLFSGLSTLTSAYFFALAILGLPGMTSYEESNLYLSHCLILVGCFVMLLLRHAGFDSTVTIRDQDNSSGDYASQDPEVEMMLPTSSTESENKSASPEVENASGTDVLYRESNTLNCLACLAASITVNCVEGMLLGSKQHRGYGGLIAAAGTTGCVSLALGTLLLQNDAFTKVYTRFIATLACSFPVGFILGSLDSVGSVFSTLYAGVSISRGFLLQIAFMTILASRTPWNYGDMVAMILGGLIAVVLSLL